MRMRFRSCGLLVLFVNGRRDRSRTAISRDACARRLGRRKVASLHSFVPEFPPSILGSFPPDPRTELWPPAGIPEPNLFQRGLTEARCVFDYYHGATTEEQLDAFVHLVNIALLKRGRSFWVNRPALRYVDRRSNG